MSGVGLVKRLIVHVGPPKTATTSVQRALYRNAELLAAHGVYLPKTARLELEPSSIGHHHLAWDLQRSPRFRQDIGGWDALEEELSNVDAETVLLSAELLAPGVFTQGIHGELDERLLALGRAVTVVYVVREPLALLNSSYGQLVKTLAATPSFDAFVEDVITAGTADLERQTSRWYDSSSFDFVAVPFPALIRSDPLVALLHAARIDVPTGALVTSGEPSNLTLGPVAVAAFRLLRRYLEGLNPGLSHDDLPVRRLHRIAARAGKDAGWCTEAFWGWTKESAAAAAEQLAESNERFSQAVWRMPWPLSMPVERLQAQVQPLDLRGHGLPKVQDFVAAMGKRYVGLLNEDDAVRR